MQYSSCVEDVKTALSGCCQKVEESKNFKDSNWTETVKIALATLGQNKGYLTCTATRERLYEAEWLYDLVWYKENEDGLLVEVPLVVESEWKRNLKDVKFDFEKLLLARSPIKLMICQANEADEQQYLKYFQQAIDLSPLAAKEDHYLIAILQLIGGDAEGFQFYMLQKGLQHSLAKNETQK